MNPKIVKKGWGHEVHIHNADGYCGKVLHFDRAGSRMSLHYHLKKTETWLFRGRFNAILVNKLTAGREEVVMEHGSVLHIPAGKAHQLIALEDHAEVFEVSTPDDPEDSYRIEPGDSQTVKEEKPPLKKYVCEICGGDATFGFFMEPPRHDKSVCASCTLKGKVP